MLVTSSRPQMGPLTSSASSPGSHHHVHHLPADLSPRSSNSSLISSNESLLNTSLSMPSPGARESGSSPRGSAVGQGEVSPLQCLQNAFSNGKSFGMLGSPGAGGLMRSPAMKCESDESQEDDMHEEEEHAMATTPTGSPSSTTNGNNLNSVANTIFQCPLCSVICNSRHDFNEHLVTHSQQHACPRCSFITSTEDDLRDHVQEVHGVDDLMEMLSDDEVKTPKTNAQGKLKTFKCKHCEHRAVTKKEFWDHTKSHIREDKMLHCPKCPFITEYKHHLEYHLRNHMGSKPYQCAKCSYSCVNKSMLNSHLKSHSNIYQYRCRDCSYATKYCHSLKLHLRKYNHLPAVVLNPDGTENPLPIIDVYGTRRGPKMKRPDPILEGLATTTPALPYSPNGINNVKPAKPTKKGMSTPVKKEKVEKPRQQHLNQNARDLSPKLASSPRYISALPNQVVTPPLKKMREDSSGDSDSDIRLQSANHHHFQNRGRITQLPQAPISPSSIALILQQTNNGMAEHHQSHKETGFPLGSPNAFQQIYSAAVNQYLMNPVLNGGASLGPASLNELAKQMTNDQQTKMLAQFLQSRVLYAQFQQQHLANDLRVGSQELRNDITVTPHCALDLRNPKNDGVVANNEEVKRRKRKGKALRYERRCSSEDEDEALDFSNNNNNNNNNDYKENKEKLKHDAPTDLSFSSSMQCKYCDISFPERDLYTMHMNYHSSDSDPFLCRSCGKRTRDKGDFFRHLITDKH